MNLSFARGWVHAALLAASCMVAGVAAAQFQLPASGCPMAHCDPSQSDQVRLPIPRSAERVAVDTGLGPQTGR